MSVKKSLFVLIFAFSFNSYADVDVKNFDFKGYKFGIEAPARSNLPPWEMTYEELNNYVLDLPYKRIMHYRESRADFLLFGHSKLSSIGYKYFDNKLYRIEVDFLKQSDCNHARVANELIQLKYGLKTEVDNQSKSDVYIRNFSNGKVLVSINCSKSILDSISNIDTTEKQTEIVFEDVLTAMRVQDYRKREDDASLKKSQKMKEDKIREKINF